MKKLEIIEEFVRLRAMSCTYDEICSELNVSKPTAIKWGKQYSEEIKQVQKNLLTNIFAQRITEDEQGLIISINSLKKFQDRSKEDEAVKKIYKRIAQRLEKIFIKEITAVQLIMKKNGGVDRAIFLFHDDAVITAVKKPTSYE